MEYSDLINIASLQALHNQANSEEEKAEFIEKLKNSILFLNSSNFALVELLEKYAINEDGQCSPLKTSLLINALYILKNNLKIENDLGEFIEFHLVKRGKNERSK